MTVWNASVFSIWVSSLVVVSSCAPRITSRSRVAAIPPAAPQPAATRAEVPAPPNACTLVDGALNGPDGTPRFAVIDSNINHAPRRVDGGPLDLGLEFNEASVIGHPDTRAFATRLWAAAAARIVECVRAATGVVSEGESAALPGVSVWIERDGHVGRVRASSDTPFVRCVERVLTQGRLLDERTCSGYWVRFPGPSMRWFRPFAPPNAADFLRWWFAEREGRIDYVLRDHWERLIRRADRFERDPPRPAEAPTGVLVNSGVLGDSR